MPWHEIDLYRLVLNGKERRELASDLTPMERALVEGGLTLSQIAWRRKKRGEYLTDSRMAAEFPATPEEAFVNTGSAVFDSADVEELRLGCLEARCADRYAAMRSPGAAPWRA